MIHRQSLDRQVWVLGVLTIALAAGCGTARRKVVDLLGKPTRAVTSRLSRSGESPSTRLSSKAAQKVVHRAITAYGGNRRSKAREGLELELQIDRYYGERVTKDPALVQLTTNWPPQIRIHYGKVDQTYGLGDQTPWVLLRGKPDRNEAFVARAHYTTAMMAFFLLMPFNLSEPGVILGDVKEETWGGERFDTVMVRFQGGGYPWPDDSMTLWFRRSNALLDRCFFVSTSKGSDFDEPPEHVPPHHLWIFWRNYEPLAGIPLPRLWSFHRSDAEAKLGDKLIDIQVEKAAAYRSFLPVLFREPIIEPHIQRLPEVRGTGPRVPVIPPKGPAIPLKGPTIPPKGPAITPKGPAITPKGPAITPKG